MISTNWVLSSQYVRPPFWLGGCVGQDAGVGVECDFLNSKWQILVRSEVGFLWVVIWVLWDDDWHYTDLAAHPPTPWREIFTSFPVWALTVALLANNWGYFTLVICFPLYMHDVLGFNIARNGAYSALPFVPSLSFGPVSGLFADWLRFKLSTTVVRKLFCVIGFSLVGCFLILIGYIGCDRALAVTTMFIILVCSTLGFPTVVANQLDLAPLHAGMIMGLTYTIGNLGAIAAPHAVSALTYEQSTRLEWRNVFFLTTTVYMVGAVVFVIFGSGERQSWAYDTNSDVQWASGWSRSK